jgi:hypothetical protein
MSHDDYYSIDRLIEFGIGLGVAQQMVRSMNEASASLHVPGALNSFQHFPTFFVMLDGNRSGPFSEAELRRLVDEKKILRETYVWRFGLPDWIMAINSPEIMRLIALSPPLFKGDEAAL